MYIVKKTLIKKMDLPCHIFRKQGRRGTTPKWLAGCFLDLWACVGQSVLWERGGRVGVGESTFRQDKIGGGGVPVANSLSSRHYPCAMVSQCLNATCPPVDHNSSSHAWHTPYTSCTCTILQALMTYVFRLLQSNYWQNWLFFFVHLVPRSRDRINAMDLVVMVGAWMYGTFAAPPWWNHSFPWRSRYGAWSLLSILLLAACP